MNNVRIFLLFTFLVSGFSNTFGKIPFKCMQEHPGKTFQDKHGQEFNPYNPIHQVKDSFYNVKKDVYKTKQKFEVVYSLYNWIKKVTFGRFCTK